MSKKQRDLTPDEKKLWRKVAASVKAHRALPKDEAPASEPAPVSPPRKREAGARQAPPGAKPSPPLQHRGNEKRIRRGRLEIGAKLDLHGHTQDSARAALRRFLSAAQARGDRTVLVITGVGRTGEGVLKRRLPEWLGESDLRPLLTGYAPAHRTHGGAGAIYVFIKRAD